MNMTIIPMESVDLSVLQRNDEFIIINPDNFTWIRTSNAGKNIVENIANGCTDREIAETLKEDVQDIIEFRAYLESEGILPLNKEIIDWHPNEDCLMACAILLTNRCNLSCNHCFYASGTTHSEDELSTQRFLQIIDQLVKFNVHYVTFTGGEPLLRKDIDRLISYARQNGLEVAILTNGLLINRERANFLSRMKVKIQISLDGANEFTYNKIRGRGFHEVIKSLKLLIECGCDVSISIVPMKENLAEIPETIELAKKLGVKNFNFSLLEHSGRAKQTYHDSRPSNNDLFTLFESLYETYYENCSQKSVRLAPVESMKSKLHIPPQRFACKAGREVIAIDWKGDLYPCSGLVGEDHKIGSLFESSLHDLYHSDRMGRIRSNIDIRNIGECKNCPFMLPCIGGCRSKAYVLDNRFDTPDPYCDYLKDMWCYLLWKISDLQIEAVPDGLLPSN